MRKLLYLLLTFLSIFIIFQACKKDAKEDKETETFGDSLYGEDNAYIESLGVPNPKLNEIIGGDGKPLGVIRRNHNVDSFQLNGIEGNLDVLNDLRSDLINKLLSNAHSLCEQKTSVEYKGDGNSANPTHMGLVYSRGQRDISNRLKPGGGNPIHLSYNVFGTDCSGLQINLLNRSGVKMPDTDVRNFESTLKKALKNSSNYKDLVLENKGFLPYDSLKSGDFILWFDAPNGGDHMGIVTAIDKNKPKMIYQSNGTGKPKDELDQAVNLSSRRGVRPIGFPDALSQKYWGGKYHILRLKSKTKDLLTSHPWKFIMIYRNDIPFVQNGAILTFKDSTFITKWDFPGGAVHEGIWKLTGDDKFIIISNLTWTQNTIFGSPVPLYYWEELEILELNEDKLVLKIIRPQGDKILQEYKK